MDGGRDAGLTILRLSSFTELVYVQSTLPDSSMSASLLMMRCVALGGRYYTPVKSIEEHGTGLVDRLVCQRITAEDGRQTSDEMRRVEAMETLIISCLERCWFLFVRSRYQIAPSFRFRLDPGQDRGGHRGRRAVRLLLLQIDNGGAPEERLMLHICSGLREDRNSWVGKRA